ncbi:hypothetical protein [Endozoicomonas sp.]|uniref:hypothetical protein n=1 Tax=Endozoicomonas sp. TaxID=1892382 RepID=UPI003839F5FB
MTESQREEHQRKVCDLADKFLDGARAKGEPFSEGLSNWALSKAEQELGSTPHNTKSD